MMHHTSGDSEQSTASGIASLPMELHLRIQREFIRDPDTTFNDLKTLRLVSKTFDIIWSPLVLSAISMFPRTVNNPNDILENLHHLHHLIHSPYHAKQFNMLIIRNWDCLNSQLYVYFAIIRLARYICEVAELKTVLYFLLTQPALCVSRFLYKPKKMPRRIASTFNRILAKYLARRLPYKLQLRQVRCARLYSYCGDGDWVVYRSTRVLLSLPQLTELELCLSWDVDMPYISKCLSDIRGLRKLALYFRTEFSKCSRRFSHPESYFSQLIARNQDLTHLTVLLHAGQLDLSKLLCDIPSDRPLKLEHVSIDDHSSNLESLVPHISPLRSIEIHSEVGDYPWYSLLSQANVFPPTLTIKAPLLNTQLVAYLNRHPGIVNLSVAHKKYIAESDSAISQVISQHAEKLQYLAVHGCALAALLRTVQDELHLLKCTALREIALIIAGNERFGIKDKSKIFPVLARLNHSLTVVIRCAETEKFKDCVEYCRATNNPLVRSLAGRIVYEKYPTIDPIA